MKSISETKRKLEHSKVDLGENSAREDYVYTKETAEKIHDQGNVELVELRRTTETIQCQACWKHIFEGMIKCCCGYMKQPTQQIINEIQDRFQKLCGPQWKAVIQSRAMKCSPQPWQDMHKRAKDALRGAMKNGKKRDDGWTILDRWYKGAQFREVQSQRHGWTIEWVTCHDYLAQIDISHKATAAQRNRYECDMKVLCNDSDFHAGLRKGRLMWNQAVSAARVMNQEEWDIPCIPVDQRER